MGLDLNAIRGRLNKLQNTQKKTDALWKPTPGKHQIRIVPYLYNKENPFIELFFHYGINNKTYLSPSSFGRPDPIVEFAEKLKRMGDKEDWKAAKAMEPKLRTYVPVIVRGEESEGVRFWGFGKTVYQEILGYIADPDYGDITDPVNGRDLTVEYVSAEDSGKTYPTTVLRIKPKETPLHENQATSLKWLEGQTPITDFYQELSYDELKRVLENWLDPSGETSQKDDPKSVVQEELSVEKPIVDVKPVSSISNVSKTLSDVESAFDDLFNN